MRGSGEVAGGERGVGGACLSVSFVLVIESECSEDKAWR